ncbi:MAG: dihydrolipoamide acetyltransferase family protein, partial [Calditrichota bacterium]
MKQNIVMPQMGESIAEGTIIEWHIKPGDAVQEDETLLEISTDKVDSDIPSPFTGVLTDILVKEGETVEVGTTIAYLETEEKATEDRKDNRKAAATVTLESEESASSGNNQSQSHANNKHVAVKSRGHAPGEFLSPLVRSIAEKENISPAELLSINGSGIGGRVRKQDLLEYLDERKAQRPAKNVQPITYTGSLDDVEVIKMDNMRQSIARHMRTSLDTSAHVYSVSEVDMSRVVDFRESHKESFLKKEGFKLTYTPFIIDATIKALKDFPIVNASLDMEKGEILQKKFINIGLAVAIEQGLIVPVIKHADERNFL